MPTPNRWFRLAAALVVLSAAAAYGQGGFLFANWGAPTHIGSLAGPLAGTNVWAQMTAGPTEDSLAPVGMPHRHGTAGIVHDGRVVVPTVPRWSVAFVQMLAWDGNLWGDSLVGVPPEQLGRTDIVGKFLVDWWEPSSAPQFSRSAIVPIPEPGAVALAGLGLALLALWRWWSGEGAAT